MTTDDRDPIDVLAEDFADRLRRGEHPSVGAYADAHPEHADQLRDLLPAVAQMEMLKRFRHPVAALPDRLGDFRIVRELGRGGMGVVFEAVQESLGRPVALKVLARHGQLDATRRERFVREAQAAAKLHHTNIVPVFGVGEQDGLPYYAMQLIPGCGLHAVVARWRRDAGLATAAANRTRSYRAPDTDPISTSKPVPLDGAEVHAPDYGDWRFVADVGLQTAHALHFAHKQGVLHRDVKPANLILDGETVWVTDFGLAKLMDTDGLTATGDILGTLQYLPPECLAGAADARSDVYGLGAALYELLTLEPPHAADSPARLIKRVADSDPAAPRQLNPDVPRDLETIVLKAMAREPAARYPSARAMAEDLEAFLDDRPIKARRTAAVARAWRWCRRNPAVAVLTLSTLGAVSLAAVAGWAGYARAEERRKDAEKARDEANTATAKAQEMSKKIEDNLKLSLATFEKVFKAASGAGSQGFGVPLALLTGGPGRPDRGPGGMGGGGPGGQGAALSAESAVLEAVLDFYDQFARQNPPNQQLKVEAAKASRRVCEAHLWLNRPEKAVTAFERAVGLLEPLVERHPEQAEWRTELAMTYAVAPPGASPRDREAPLRRAVELADGSPWVAATAQLRLGLAREQTGDRPGAETAYRAAVGSFLAADPASKPTPGHLELAFARLRLAWVLCEERQLTQARKVLEESAASLHKVVDTTDSRFRPEREWLVLTYSALEDVCRELKDGRADAARASAVKYGGGGGFGPGGPKKDNPGGGFGFGPGGLPWGWKKDAPPRKDRKN
jgi:serine/threonine protein kinase